LALALRLIFKENCTKNELTKKQLRVESVVGVRDCFDVNSFQKRWYLQLFMRIHAVVCIPASEEKNKLFSPTYRV
jgi:hypothetical protein